MKKIIIGADHAGFEYKREIIEYLQMYNYEVIDCGPHSSDSVDYPLFGKTTAEKVISEEADLGIVICGTGIGISNAANKVTGIRCSLVSNDEELYNAIETLNINMLAFGSRTQSISDIKHYIFLYFENDFIHDKENLDKLKNIEIVEKNY